MRRNRNFRFVMATWGAAIVVMMIMLAANAVGLRFNETASVPIGLWHVTPPKGALKRSDIVSFCPPDNAIFRMAHERGYIHNGTCPSGLQPLLKPVAAISGDIVVIDESGVSVNYIRLRNSHTATTDRYGRALMPFPSGIYRLSENEVWLLTDNAASFDSRYFGTVPIVNIKGVAKSLWIIAN